MVRIILFTAILLWLSACLSIDATQQQEMAADLATATVALAEPLQFDGNRALDYVAAQVAMGPRFPGSDGHLKLRDYLESELTALGWEVERQAFVVNGFSAENIIARANQNGDGELYIIGAHYDTRARSDQSPNQRDTPTVGAVDGGSGVAVLLELARTLDLDTMESEIWLAFFDVEDNGSGGIAGWDWILGSSYMAQNLTRLPDAMILVDMVGQQQQELYYEGNSTPELRENLWQIAADLGYGESFMPQLRHTMIDDHVPFLRRGIPAVDIIDFDYPYWHTVEDTLDKVDPAKLEEVGRVVEVWLELR